LRCPQQQLAYQRTFGLQDASNFDEAIAKPHLVTPMALRSHNPPRKLSLFIKKLRVGTRKTEKRPQNYLFGSAKCSAPLFHPTRSSYRPNR
jgi:hypothetical protein